MKMQSPLAALSLEVTDTRRFSQGKAFTCSETNAEASSASRLSLAGISARVQYRQPSKDGYGRGPLGLGDPSRRHVVFLPFFRDSSKLFVPCEWGLFDFVEARSVREANDVTRKGERTAATRCVKQRGRGATASQRVLSPLSLCGV